MDENIFGAYFSLGFPVFELIKHQFPRKLSSLLSADCGERDPAFLDLNTFFKPQQ